MDSSKVSVSGVSKIKVEVFKTMEIKDSESSVNKGLDDDSDEHSNSNSFQEHYTEEAN